jgi:hypothetical protein
MYIKTLNTTCAEFHFIGNRLGLLTLRFMALSAFLHLSFGICSIVADCMERGLLT